MVSRNTALALVAVAAVALVAVAAVGLTQGNGNGGGEPQASVAYDSTGYFSDFFEDSDGHAYRPDEGNTFFILTVKLAPHGYDIPVRNLFFQMSTADGAHVWNKYSLSIFFWAYDESLAQILDGTTVAIPVVFKIPSDMVDESLATHIEWSTWNKVPFVHDADLEVTPFAPAKG